MGMEESRGDGDDRERHAGGQPEARIAAKRGVTVERGMEPPPVGAGGEWRNGEVYEGSGHACERPPALLDCPDGKASRIGTDSPDLHGKASPRHVS
jgi:hypothetical protein